MLLSLSRGGTEPAPEAVVVEHGGRGDRHGGECSEIGLALSFELTTKYVHVIKAMTCPVVITT